VTRFCPDKGVHAGPHEWYDPALRHDCPGLPDHAAVLAARFFDDNQAVADRRSGIAEWATALAKQQYIADVVAEPVAVAALRRMYAITEETPL
jgi:hypothetical protein